MVRSTEEERVYGETRSDAIQRLGPRSRFGTPPQRTARRGGQWPAWWSASRQALPHNGALAARGESLASHRDGRGAPLARHDDREYRDYSREEQRSQRGCIARRMQPDFHHGLIEQVADPAAGQHDSDPQNDRSEDRRWFVAVAAGEANEDVAVLYRAHRGRQSTPVNRCVGALRSSDGHASSDHLRTCRCPLSWPYQRAEGSSNRLLFAYAAATAVGSWPAASKACMSGY